jgi:hypothetical protein
MNDANIRLRTYKLPSIYNHNAMKISSQTKNLELTNYPINAMFTGNVNIPRNT